MFRLVTVTVRSLCLFFGLAGLAAAQDPPALEPPSLEPPRSGTAQDPPAPAPKPESTPKAAASPAPNAPIRPAAGRPESRPMLAIPGITAPPSRPPGVVGPQLASPARARTSPFPSAPDALPPPPAGLRSRALGGAEPVPLDGPPSPPSLDALPTRPDASAASRSSNGAMRSRPWTPTGQPAGETIPLTIEPIDGDSPIARTPTGRPATARPSNARTSDGPATARPDDEPAEPRPAPRRGTSILGRLFGPPPAPPPTSRESTRSEAKPKNEPDSETDLDPDVIARRRIERQIRATLGDKVRSFDVRITGRNVVVTAQPSRFWLRRSVRHSLETLPALQGYRARIEISD